MNIAQRKGVVLLALLIWFGTGWALPLEGFGSLAWAVVGVAILVASHRWSDAGPPVDRDRAAD
jgi:hypothetical protein